MNLHKANDYVRIANSIKRPVLFNGCRSQGFLGNMERLQNSGSEFFCISYPGDTVQLDPQLKSILQLAEAHLMELLAYKILENDLVRLARNMAREIRSNVNSTL